jgi:parallel beta-helix repeat protein
MSGLLKLGIFVTESSGNRITGNNATGSGWISEFGIGLLESNHNEIEDNTVQSNGIFGQGIRLMSSRGNTISDNEASCNGPMGQTIAILQSSYNTISGNSAQSWLWGRDMAFEGFWGIRLSGNHAERIRGDP